MEKLLIKDHFCEGEFPVMVEVMPYREIENSRWHTHEFSELTLIFSGECIHRCNGKYVKLQSEDMVLLHPGSCHCFEGEYKAISLLYDASAQYPPIASSDMPFVKIFYPGEDDDRDQAEPFGKFPQCDFVLIENLLLRLRYELRHRRIGHNLMTMAVFTEIVTFIARGSNPAIKRKEFTRMHDVVLYMNNHYGEKIDFQHLAKVAGSSKRALFYHFNAVFSMTPGEYLAQIRLHHAQEMLRNGISVKETAHQCGFADSSHLCRVFKKKTGKSPANWLLENSGKI